MIQWYLIRQNNASLLLYITCADFTIKQTEQSKAGGKPFIYEARESSLVPEGFLEDQFSQELWI